MQIRINNMFVEGTIEELIEFAKKYNSAPNIAPTTTYPVPPHTNPNQYVYPSWPVITCWNGTPNTEVKMDISPECNFNATELGDTLSPFFRRKCARAN